MRPSNKSRSRNKNNNRRPASGGNIVNRVFDSAGPSGKVRGTPQQIVEKYASMASDATLAGDRVAAENYLQHSEHYSRLLSVALKEQAERQAEHQKQQQAQQEQAQQARQQREAEEKARQAAAVVDEQPPMASVETEVVELVETPEDAVPAKPKRRARTKQAVPKVAKEPVDAPAID